MYRGVIDEAPTATPGVRIDGRRRTGEVVATAMVTVVAVLALAAALRWSVEIFQHRSQGFDPSDEAYYLLAADDPDSQIARQSNFGYYLSILLRAGGGSLAWFRVVGLLSLLASCGAVGWALSRWTVPALGPRARAAVAVGCGCCVAAAALSTYGLWIVTPGYNLLGLVFALLAAAASVWILAGPAPDELRLWPPAPAPAALALTLVLLTDAKLSAGGVIGALALAAITLKHGTRGAVRLLPSLALGVAAGALVHLAVVGSPVATVRETRRYITMTVIQGTHPAENVWETAFVGEEVVPWLLLMTAAAVAITVLWRWVRSPAARTTLMTVAVLVATSLLWSSRPRGGALVFGGNSGWWWLQMTGWMLLFLTALAPARRAALASGPLLALFAIGVAAGSNNGFIRQTAMSAGLYAVGIISQALVVATGRGWQPWRAFPAAVFIGAAAIVSFNAVPDALADPYRQVRPIGGSDTPVDLGDFGRIQVTPELASYLSGLKEIAPKVPDEARDCLMDLAGGTPIAAIALDAQSATIPWMSGGYVGSDAMAEYLSGFSPCLHGQVLLIEAPGGERSIERPVILRDRPARILGEVRFDGYLSEVHVVSVLAPES